MLSTRNLSLPGTRKLQVRFIGPFEIVARIGKVAYKLRLPQLYSQLHDVFHVSLLREYDGSGEHRHFSPALPIVSGDGEVEFEVEKILRHRRKRGRGKEYQYLIKWKGYNVEDATWENDSNLEKAQDIVSAYWQSQI